MSRGEKGFLSGLTRVGLSLMLVVAGASFAQTTTAGPVGGTDDLAPGPVSGLVAAVDLAGPSVTLSWALSGDDFVRQTAAGGDFTSGGVFVNTNDVAGYQIWRTALTSPQLVATVAAGSTMYEDTTVLSGNTYTYQVKAVDAAGNVSAAVTSEPVNLGPPPVARITVPLGTVADSVKFGQVAADEIARKQFVFANVATAVDAGALRVTITVSGAGFAVNKTAMAIAKGSRDSVTVSFDARATQNIDGLHAGLLVFRTNDPTKVVTTYQLAATVVGGVAPPTIDLSAVTIGFARTTVDSTSERTLTIRNTGGLELTGTIAVSGTGEFAISETAFALAGDAAVDVTVSFTPADTILYEGTVTITSNDPATGAATVTLTGRGSTRQGQLVDPITGAPIYGDSDGDGEVTFEDFFAFADAFGSGNPAFDFDGNGEVNFDDFFMFADSFGKSGTYVGG